MNTRSNGINNLRSHSCPETHSVDSHVGTDGYLHVKIRKALYNGLKSVLKQVPLTPTLRIKGFFVSDMLCAAVSVYAGFTLSPSYSLSGVQASHLSMEATIVALCAGFAFSGLATGAYDRSYPRTGSQSFLPVAMAALMAWGILLALNYAFFYRYIGRWIVLTSTVILIPAAVGSRALLLLCGKVNDTGILVVGTESTAYLIESACQKIGAARAKVSDVLPENLSTILDQRLELDPRLRAVCESDHVDLVMVEGECDRDVLCRALDYLKEGKRVSGFVWYFENTFQKAPVEKIDPGWLISAHLDLMKPLGRTVKRFLDLSLAGFGLILCLPLWPLIGILIKVSSPGPIFYYQRRVGIYGSEFSLIKFRSMIDRAESAGRPLWAGQNDSRVTWIGRILRKTRLDETPQFINVLKGDMSLVGPRPERPEFVATLSSKIPHYGLRHLVKPGITGWAQIMHGYAASEEEALEKLCYDLYYIKHGSAMLDLTIVIRTVGAVMRGAR